MTIPRIDAVTYGVFKDRKNNDCACVRDVRAAISRAIEEYHEILEEKFELTRKIEVCDCAGRKKLEEKGFLKKVADSSRGSVWLNGGNNLNPVTHCPLCEKPLLGAMASWEEL